MRIKLAQVENLIFLCVRCSTLEFSHRPFGIKNVWQTAHKTTRDTPDTECLTNTAKASSPGEYF